eukprot:GHVT01010592.1.p1 GENE.GHVT01010592.1~~GHVT01010592.1.p1  ORF type:complete len:137 (-),score=19.20 GHVT01010592.1:1545-1955(-)
MQLQQRNVNGRKGSYSSGVCADAIALVAPHARENCRRRPRLGHALVDAERILSHACAKVSKLRGRGHQRMDDLCNARIESKLVPVRREGGSSAGVQFEGGEESRPNRRLRPTATSCRQRSIYRRSDTYSNEQDSSK